MAGSFQHVVNRNMEFEGVDGLDNLGDAYEALEEMYLMIMYLSGGDKQKIKEAYVEGYFKQCCPIENLHFVEENPYWMPLPAPPATEAEGEHA